VEEKFHFICFFGKAGNDSIKFGSCDNFMIHLSTVVALLYGHRSVGVVVQSYYRYEAVTYLHNYVNNPFGRSLKKLKTKNHIAQVTQRMELVPRQVCLFKQPFGKDNASQEKSCIVHTSKQLISEKCSISSDFCNSSLD